MVLDVPEEEKVADSEWMVTSNDERLLVSKNAAIGSDDIYGILIEKTTYRGITQYDITLYFKQESFDKIRDISSRFMKKRLAIVREHSLVGAPIVQEAFTQSVNIFSSMDLDTFKKGFLVLEQSAVQEYNQRTTDWIEEKLKKDDA